MTTEVIFFRNGIRTCDHVTLFNNDKWGTKQQLNQLFADVGITDVVYEIIAVY